ncbi:citrate synthase [Devosia pacifica]|uniref:Citrate synthase n=1 Tax=Devosia pacifica TaxID=1335967 RepID=A0A918SDU6_9HYPH|nr:citrate synthase [Devosia pacifica]GHA36116.1 citrate synthase [Devosia pacifica]
MQWLTREQALAILGTKPQSLYASVSRGRIRTRVDEADTRRSLYAAADVERLASRARGRRSANTIAAQTMRWGDPVLTSSISTVEGGRLFYRGRDAARLAVDTPFEDVIALLWGTQLTKLPSPRRSETAAFGSTVAMQYLATCALNDVPSLGRSTQSLQLEAESLLANTLNAFFGYDGGAVHLELAERWSCPQAAETLRKTLVLLAEHELNASTFAARVAASTGAPLSACLLSGLSTLTGPLHGGAWHAVALLLRDAEMSGADAALRSILAQGQRLPAFGHPLYPDGDIRAAVLLDALELPPYLRDVLEMGETLTGEKPNIDFALTAVSVIHRLPPGAPFMLFSMARCVGWLAHAIEQSETGGLIRPRTEYAGPGLET